VARRIHRAPNGDQVEIVGMGYQHDTRHGWVFRNPRSGHWQTGDMLDKGNRHRGPRGGLTDQQLARGGYFMLRYRVGGQEYYRKEYHSSLGPLGRLSGKDLLAAFTPPEPGKTS
jgi:hypothetical protein